MIALVIDVRRLCESRQGIEYPTPRPLFDLRAQRIDPEVIVRTETCSVGTFLTTSVNEKQSCRKKKVCEKRLGLVIWRLRPRRRSVLHHWTPLFLSCQSFTENVRTGDESNQRSPEFEPAALAGELRGPTTKGRSPGSRKTLEMSLAFAA